MGAEIRTLLFNLGVTGGTIVITFPNPAVLLGVQTNLLAGDAVVGVSFAADSSDFAAAVWLTHNKALGGALQNDRIEGIAVSIDSLQPVYIINDGPADGILTLQYRYGLP